MKSLMICVMIFVLSLNISAAEYKIFNSEGKRVSLNDISSMIHTHHVTFFGEYHDNALLHKLEHIVLQLAYIRNRNIAVSMEMFETDVQHTLNNYLNGHIQEETFLVNSRAWPNYGTDYRSIIEFCKKRSLPVIASNIPRRIASSYAQKGSLDNISENDRRYIPRQHIVLKDKYMDIFFSTMSRMPGGKMGNTRMKHALQKKLMNYYSAQCLKDDTMAESIFAFLKKYPQTSIIHYNGDFHSRYKLGTAQKLSLLSKDIKTLVISPISLSKDVPFDYDPAYSDNGDILIFYQQ